MTFFPLRTFLPCRSISSSVTFPVPSLTVVSSILSVVPSPSTMVPPPVPFIRMSSGTIWMIPSRSPPILRPLTFLSSPRWILLTVETTIQVPRIPPPIRATFRTRSP